MENTQAAQAIIPLMGGNNNINKIWHCMTRLRFDVVDESRVEWDAIKKLPGVLGAQYQRDQVQVIIGPQVTLWYQAIMAKRDPAAGEATVKTHKGLISRFMDTVSGVFGPIVPAIAGAGMIKGLLAGLIALMGVAGYLMASRKPAVTVSVGERIPFHRVFSRVWLYGLALGFGTIGFGVIATFITLYYGDRGWEGAAFSLTLFSLGFVGIRLIFSNNINRYGGLKVSLVSFLFEIGGLLLIWGASTPLMVECGAFLTGAGFSLVFPALGVEAVKQVPVQNQGTALGLYSAFLDLGLGLTGPVAGLIINHAGITSIYLVAALTVGIAWLITLKLQLSRRLPPETGIN